MISKMTKTMTMMRKMEPSSKSQDFPLMNLLTSLHLLKVKVGPIFSQGTSKEVFLSPMRQHYKSAQSESLIFMEKITKNNPSLATTKFLMILVKPVKRAASKKN